MANNRKTRAKMPIEQRAKQFMPFAAVTGLEDALRKKEQEIETSRTINRGIYNDRADEYAEQLCVSVSLSKSDCKCQNDNN